MSETKTNLLDLDRDAMRAFFVELGEKPFRADQIMKWIYHFGCDDFDQMSNVNKALRERLKAIAEIRAPRSAVNSAPPMAPSNGRCRWAIRRSRPSTFRSGPRYPVRLLPGRLRPGVHLLLHRPARVQPQPESLRDHRPGVACRQSGGGKRPITNVVMMGMGERCSTSPTWYRP
jgi:23S rRNA (adenine2503-C2)-methyltransferase